MAKIVTATTTFSREPDLRSQLARRAAKAAGDYDFPIVVVDGGSHTQLRDELKALGAHLFDEEKAGMGNSRRQAMRIAGEMVDPDGVVIWTEPEKYTLFQWKPSSPSQY